MNFNTAIKEKTKTEVLVLNGEAFSLRMTHPEDQVWRLQSAASGNDFDEFGAAQILARDLGEKVPDERADFLVFVLCVWNFTLPSALLNLYLYIKENPTNILKHYAGLSGYALIPAPWLFGFHYTDNLRVFVLGK